MYSISHVVSLPDSLSISFMSNDMQHTLIGLFSINLIFDVLFDYNNGHYLLDEIFEREIDQF